jgi:replicative DNA helicase
MGKTAFTLTMARNMAVEHNRAVGIFSLEMSSLQLVNRLIISETELSSEKIRNGNLTHKEWDQLEHKIKNLVNAPLYIDDTPAISIFELRSKYRRLKDQYNVEAVFVDYLQLMSGPSDHRGNREQEVSVISRSLKGIAKELNIPIIALSQLNRSVELRSGEKRPQLSDLRESGAIEQDADMVLFIHRPERYGITEDAYGNSLIGISEIILAKHRNGALADIHLKFREEIAKFEELNDEGLGYIEEEEDDSGSMIIGSRMNEEDNEQNSSQSPPDMNSNTGFDEETPF